MKIILEGRLRMIITGKIEVKYLSYSFNYILRTLVGEWEGLVLNSKLELITPVRSGLVAIIRVGSGLG